MGEREIIEKVEGCVPEVGGEVNDVDYSNQDEENARGDGRVYAFLSLVPADPRVQLVVQLASP